MKSMNSQFQIVIIDDDIEMESRPLYEELVEKYGSENVIWKSNADDGLSFLKKNLTKRTIVILDYDFGVKYENGLLLFQQIQSESSLIYIILNTAKSVVDIPSEELKVFINNHLMALVDKTDGYEKTLMEVIRAFNSINNRIDCILEEWIFQHEQFKREEPFIIDELGKQISLNDILNEIRKNTELGKSFSNKIISTAITLIQRDIDIHKRN